MDRIRRRQHKTIDKLAQYSVQHNDQHQIRLILKDEPSLKLLKESKTFDAKTFLHRVINLVILHDDSETAQAIIECSLELEYEDQVTFANYVFEHQQHLAMMLSDSGKFSLAAATLARSAFKGNNEQMVDYLMERITAPVARSAIFQYAITNSCPLIRKFVDELAMMVVKHSFDQRLLHPVLLPELEDMKECFDFSL